MRGWSRTTDALIQSRPPPSGEPAGDSELVEGCGPPQLEREGEGQREGRERKRKRERRGREGEREGGEREGGRNINLVVKKPRSLWHNQVGKGQLHTTHNT